MTAHRPSSTAVVLLERLACADPTVIGDVEESYRRGRSRLWLWRQVVGLIAWNARRWLFEAPGQVAASMLVGWAVVIVVFLFGDTIAHGAARALWGWSSEAAYARDWWWPFHLTATVVSYGGFVMSAWAVARFSLGGPIVVLHTASVFVGLVLAAAAVEVIMARQGYVPTPHPVFYFLHVTLPYQWRSGLALVPLVMLFAGTVAAKGRSRGDYTSAAESR